MLKRTLFFTNPCRISVKNKQIVIEIKESKVTKSAPIEDLGFIVLENQQISVSLPLLEELVNNNVAVIFCNKQHLPSSMLLNLDGHHLQQELFKHQVNASLPLKKNLWKQTIEAKIRNQEMVLKKYLKNYHRLSRLRQNVKSGDMDNREGAAARIYWTELFGGEFVRDRYGLPPNNMLNYAYAILRAAVARALSGSGLLNTLGIHHHNRYNAFCLADDIMEPYRPFADALVYQLHDFENPIFDLNTEVKLEIIKLLSMDVLFAKQRSPLMVGLSQTTASLTKCFAGLSKKIIYPELVT